MSQQPESVPAPPDLPGYQLGRYLGGGASGMVWAVTRESDQARLAAKVLLAPVESALTEIACLQRLDHEHVLGLRDTVLDTSGPVPRVAMVTDLAEGGSLGAAIAGRGHLSVGELVTVLTPLARTLHDLHGQGLVHGDLSPANVLLDLDGKPLLADFGVARLGGDGAAEVWGTEGYVAPEVLAGGVPDAAADVYALGALAWTALVGTAPPPAVLRPHLPDVAPQAPAALCDLVLCCLSHTPPARPDAGELALTIWDSAPAQPAPRAGSTGSRLAAPAHEPWTGLTQRIRETAHAPTPERERRWHQMPAARQVLMAAAVLGLVSGAAVVWPRSAVQVRGEVLAAPSPRPAAARAPVVEVPPRSLRTPVRRAPTTAPPARRSPVDGQADALRADPRGVVQRLVDARARAWTTSGRQLGAALAVDSAAWQRDRRDLQTADAAGASYRGLRFTVRDATIRQLNPRRALVRTVVDRSAYQVTGAAGGTAPARLAERALLTLQRTAHGWRIADWAVDAVTRG